METVQSLNRVWGGLQVYLMDKRFVDPRRPKGTPTAEEKAEMLPPYAAELVFSSQLYASHKEVVEGLRGQLAEAGK